MKIKSKIINKLLKKILRIKSPSKEAINKLFYIGVDISNGKDKQVSQHQSYL